MGATARLPRESSRLNFSNARPLIGRLSTCCSPIVFEASVFVGSIRLVSAVTITFCSPPRRLSCGLNCASSPTVTTKSSFSKILNAVPASTLIL